MLRAMWCKNRIWINLNMGLVTKHLRWVRYRSSWTTPRLHGLFTHTAIFIVSFLLYKCANVLPLITMSFILLSLYLILLLLKQRIIQSRRCSRLLSSCCQPFQDGQEVASGRTNFLQCSTAPSESWCSPWCSDELRWCFELLQEMWC